MSFITTDFETVFQSAKNKGELGRKYSLKSMTYEEYLRDELFKVHGFAYQIDLGEKIWVEGEDAEKVLCELFPEGNRNILLAHNVYFEAAILEWVFGLQAYLYYCTQSMSKAIWPQYPASLEALSRRCYPNDPDKWKRKEDLQYSDGVYHLNEEQRYITMEYCKQDIHATFHSFQHMWNLGFPRKELDVIDLTVKMFVRRPIELDKPLMEQHLAREIDKREQAIKLSGLSEKLLASNDKFHDYLQLEHGIKLEPVLSPTKKNPLNTKIPLSQDDIEFLEVMDENPELQHIWDARRVVKSNIEISRSKRFLNHAQISRINPLGRLASYLGYYNAHTGRWGGGNKTNHQNLGRRSALRTCLKAPKKKKMIIRDLSNIEGRVNAWFCGEWDKMTFIAGGGDIYNRLGGQIYGRPIDRKTEADKDAGFVSKMAELGLGYNMGARTFRLQLATSYMRMLIKRSEAQHVVDTWRQSNPAIVAMWRELSHVIADMANPNIIPYCIGTNDCVRVEYCRLVLPNGLALTYPDLKPIDHPESYLEFDYWDGHYRKKLYGGLLLENCIAGDAEILTPDGWIRLDQYRPGIKVWDGIEFVTGGDLLHQGTKETLQLNGVWLTPDHKVLTSKGVWDEASSQLQRPDLADVRLPDSHGLYGERWEKESMESEVCLREHHNQTELGTDPKAGNGISELRLQNQRNTETATHTPRHEQPPSVCRMAVNERSLPTAKPSSLGQLWRQGYRSLQAMAEQFSTFLGRYRRYLRDWSGTEQNRQQWALPAGQLQLDNSKREHQKQAQQPDHRHPHWNHDACRSGRTVGDQCHHSALPNTERLASRQTVRSTRCHQPVFDIANCGPRHRFVVRAPGHQPFIAHNCVQALSRIIMSDAMVNLQHRWEQERLDAEIALTVHDEIVAMVAEPLADQLNRDMEFEMAVIPHWADKRLALASSGVISDHYVKD